MLKEQVAEILKTPPIKLRGKPHPAGEVDLEKLAELIINLLKAAVDKLTVIGQDPVAIVQLQHTKKQLLEGLEG